MSTDQYTPLVVNGEGNGYDSNVVEEAPYTPRTLKRMRRAMSYPPHDSEYMEDKTGLYGVVAPTAADARDVLEDMHGSSGGWLPAGSMVAAVYTLCSISLGLGVFVLPVVFKSLGIITGTVCLLVMGAWSYITQIWLIRAADDVHSKSYEDLANTAFSVPGKVVLAFFTAFTLLIGNAGHMKAVVQLLHDIMEWYVTGHYGRVEFTTQKRIILYVLLLSVALPFTTGKRIGALRYISSVSVLTVLTTCVWVSGECMLWYWPHNHQHFTGKNRAILATDDWKAYAANVPALAFAFTGTFCVFPVYAELTDAKRNIRKSIAISTAVCTIGYATVALIGILTFGTLIGRDPVNGSDASNYLYVFPPDHYVVSFLCFVLVVVITLLYPVINYPMLNAVLEIMRLCGLKSVAKWPHIRLVITLCGMVFVVFLNSQFKSLVVLFGFCGGWGVGFVGYIIPSAVFLKCCPDAPVHERLLAVLSIVVMALIIVGFTYVQFF